MDAAGAVDHRGAGRDALHSRHLRRCDEHERRGIKREPSARDIAEAGLYRKDPVPQVDAGNRLKIREIPDGPELRLRKGADIVKRLLQVRGLFRSQLRHGSRDLLF